MQKLNKPTNFGVLWAQNGSRTEIDNKQPIGWEVEIPKREVMNGLQYRQDYGIAYLLQNGVADYDNNSVYYTGQIANVSGVLYRAKEQTQGVSPTTGANRDRYWEKVSPTWGDFTVVVNRINSADPFNQYLLKSNPQTSAVYVGAGLKSNQDTNLQLVYDSGLKYKVGTTTQYQFSPVDMPTSDNTKNIATTEWVQRLVSELFEKTQIGIGETIITKSNISPEFTKGYGSWVLDFQGETPVGVSQKTESPSWTKAVDSTHGSYTVALSLGQMPRHNHYTDSRFNKLTAIARDIYADTELRQTTTGNPDYDTLDTELGVANIRAKAKLLMVMKDAGEGQPHENVQPSRTRFFWTRVA